MSRPTERRIADVLVCHLRKSHSLAREVRHYEKRIDIVATGNGENEMLGFEVKVRDWNRALGQAVVNLAVVDRSYIAIAKNYSHLVQIQVLKELGIGLLVVGTRWGDVETVLPATPSPYVNKIAQSRLIEMMGIGE